MALSIKPSDSDDEIQAILGLQVITQSGLVAPVIAKRGIRFYCYLCSVYISSVLNLTEHISGKNHCKAMSLEVQPDSKYQDLVEQQKMSSMGVEVAPGEPVPPGFEDEVKRVPEIMETLNAMDSPLLGLEFLAEVVGPSKETDIRYLCMLCDKKGTRSTVMQHLVCFNHRIRYITRFFPRTYAALQTVPKISKYRRGTGEILSKIARAIESKFGRFEPMVYDEKDFEEKKCSLFQTMLQGPHAIETPTCEFHTLVNLEEIQKIASRTLLSLEIDQETEEAKRLSATAKTAFKYGLSKDEVFHKKSPSKELEPRESRKRSSISPISSLSSLSSRSRSRSRGRRYSKSPKRRRFYAPARSTSSQMWSRGRSRTRSKSRSRSRSPLRKYRRRSPYRRYPPRRSPPRYLRRDSSPYRSTPSRATISFKIKSTPSLSQKELEEEKARKLKIRQYEDYAAKVKEEMALKLKTYEKTPEKHPLYSDEWKKFWNRRYKELMSEGKDAAKHDFKPEWIKYWTGRIKSLHEEEITKRLNEFRADLGLPVAKDDESEDDEVVILSQPPKHDPEPESEALDENPTLIHVLRLLAALEDQLGSFRLRVNAIFTKALSLEKVEKCSADTLLDTPEIVVLFEGVKEKLKGQLFTGVIEKHLIRGTKKAIQGLACVLSNHEKNKLEKLKPPEPSEPLVVPGVGVIDKMAIAQQIASTLVEQGRTDLTDEDLEQLIAAVVGLAHVQPSQPAAVPVEEKETTSLQDLLSSVVSTQSASDSLQMLQNYGEEETTAKKKEHDVGSLLHNIDSLSRSEQELVKKFVRNIERDDRPKNKKSRKDEPSRNSSGKLSPFSTREGSTNPANIDDDDDYSYEDIFRAAKKNVRNEAKKKKEDKQVAMKMIDDQQKSSLENAQKPALLIDPDDLLNGIKSSMAQNAPTLAPVEQPAPAWDGYQYPAQSQQHYDFTADSTFNYNNEQNFTAQNNYQQMWPEPTYQPETYNTNNGFDYGQQIFNVPPPDPYGNPAPGNFQPVMNHPPTQYPGYF